MTKAELEKLFADLEEGARQAGAGVRRLLVSALCCGISIAFSAGSSWAEKPTVGGHRLSDFQAKQISYIATEVMPKLPKRVELKGTKDPQLEQAARATWWALREGVLSDWAKKRAGGNLFRFNSCSPGDRQIGLLEQCGPGRAWQVGYAAVQAFNDQYGGAWQRQYKRIQDVISEAFPGTDAEARVLKEAANLAGLSPGETQQVLALPRSPLRDSWLLRHPVVGFAMSARFEVTPECFPATGKGEQEDNCFNRKTDDSVLFAADKQQALRSLEDIRKLLSGVAHRQ
ncbi:MAG TPA: hypothetical protein VIA62_10450 [Thermoanaerobaculia bacterium]|jgi:hypothetical protein|nr:hypothetical protein [Thermoanaerobaculia bacterium]